MKKITFLLLLIPIFSFSQWIQVGTSIFGEAANDESGVSVSLNNDGSIMAIGAVLNDGNGNNSGHVRIYKNISGTWTKIGMDIDGEAENDQSGWSVSLNDDGSIVAIGAVSNNGNGSGSGHVRVYKNISGTWTQIGQDINGEASVNALGWSVSLNDDGSIVAIGAFGNAGNGYNSGHVRVYRNISGTWTKIGMDIDGEALGDESGKSVSLNDDGSIVAIGANNNDGNGTDSGHVRVYKNISGTWTQIGQDIDGESEYDLSGRSVSLNDDGSIVAIGANNNDGNGYNSGHVRVYKNMSGTWTKIGMDIDGEAENDKSGWSVSLNNDGSIVAIGANKNDGNGTDSGHVRVYKNISGTWTQMGQDINGENAAAWAGYSVSLNNDGSIMAIGAPLNNVNGNVRVFTNANLSIENNTFGSQFSIYPNPSFGVSKMQLGETYNEVSVNVFNVLGKQVTTQTHNNINVIELNTQEFTTGIYFVKVQSSVKEATIKLVVK